MLFKSKNEHVHLNNLYLGNDQISRVGKYCNEKYVRFLGIWIDDTLSFDGHIAKLKAKLNSGLYALSTCNHIVPLKIRKLIYRSLIESHLHFGAIIYGAANSKLLEPIEILQRKAVRLVARAKYNAHTDPLFKMFRILKHSDLVHLNQTVFVRMFKNKKLPCSFDNFFQNLTLEEQKSRDDDYNLKQKSNNSNLFLYYPSVQLIRNWNRNSIVLKSEADISCLKNDFTTFKLNSYEEDCNKLNCYVCKRK